MKNVLLLIVIIAFSAVWSCGEEETKVSCSPNENSRYNLNGEESCGVSTVRRHYITTTNGVETEFFEIGSGPRSAHGLIITLMTKGNKIEANKKYTDKMTANGVILGVNSADIYKVNSAEITLTVLDRENKTISGSYYMDIVRNSNNVEAPVKVGGTFSNVNFR